MKYIAKSSSSPPLLAIFVADGSTKTWKTFRNENSDIVSEINIALWRDQRGLCAYCEVDLQMSEGVGYSDFRIEHFHPKSDNHPQWTYQWKNLLAVCCGGNRDHLVEVAADRFTSPDHSCDVPKNDKNLDGIIFNPSTDKALVAALFEYKNDGEMLVSSQCPLGLREIANRTIVELNLSSVAGEDSKIYSTRIKKQRAAMLAGLEQQVALAIDTGLSVEESLDYLARVLFRDDVDQWPKFFSCVRWYLGLAAENRLTDIGYQG